MDLADAAAALNGEQLVDALLDGIRRFPEGVVFGRDLRKRRAGEVVADGVGDDEIAVGQPLHQRARAEAVRAVIREVRLAEDVQAGHVAHQVVVDPEAAHRVMDGGVDAHRHLVGVLVRDLLVHVEEVAVLLLDRLETEPLDRVVEIEIDGEPAVADAAAVVARLLGVAGGDVARHQVAEARVLPLEVVVALVLRDLLRRTRVALLLRNPHAAIVPQAFAHQRELRLVIAGDRNAGRVNLGEAGVGEQRAALVRAPRRGDVRVHRVRREVVDGPVTARGENHGVGRIPLHLAGDQVARDDAARPAVDDDQIEHLAPREQAAPLPRWTCRMSD